ncbi:MAG: DUF3243 family protein [Dehalococcoidales bacterium]|nr:DUF3243 family protein [Dehalococcoidales bacterium]
METAGKCTASMDFSEGWRDWKSRLKQSVENSRAYYQDETINNLLQKLNVFLNNKVCASNMCEEMIAEMWDAGTSEERKTIATLFLKIADRL